MLRIATPLALLAAFSMVATVTMTPAALAAPDDCVAAPPERAAFIAAKMLEQLDRGAGPAGHPAWMRQYLLDADAGDARLTRYCNANPDAKLADALNRLAEPDAANAR